MEASINTGNASMGFDPQGCRVYKGYWICSTNLGTVGFDRIRASGHTEMCTWNGYFYMLPWWPIVWVDVVIIRKRF